MIPLLASLVSELGTAYCVLLPLSAVVASWLVARRARVPAALVQHSFCKSPVRARPSRA
jgi:hypothetical protein